MNTQLNIVELIEHNPISRLSNTYQNKLLIKIKENFTDNEQQMFIASFYCYLNYENKTEFVIDLDDIWRWLGFNQKVKAKLLLEKNFIADKDYKLFTYKNINPSLSTAGKQWNHTKGGQNKEIIMLTIKTFKLFCLKAGTKKAEQIHEYYVKLEEILQELLCEESNEMRLQLKTHAKQLQEKDNQIYKQEEETDKIRERTLLGQFPNNTQCIYYGVIDNVSNTNERLIKFGNSNNLTTRVGQHKKTYINFRLINAFRVENKLQIENAIKEHVLFNDRQRTIHIKNKNYVELLNIEGISFTELNKTIKEIITSIEYSPENYMRLLDENKLLKRQIESNNEINNTTNFIMMQTENARLKIENIQLIKKINKANIIYEQIPSEMLPLEVSPVTLKEIENYGIIVNTYNKNFTKNKDGTYNVDGNTYAKLVGTRQEVWSGMSHKTSGGLVKDELILNKNGKIVSKKKCIQETVYKRFEKCGVNKV